jgi:AraC-like DNA-binding protein
VIDAVRPLDRYPLIRTKNAEEMIAAFERMYTRPKLLPERRASRIDAVINHHKMQDVSVVYAEYGTAVHSLFSEGATTLQMFPLRGRGELKVGGTANPLRYSGSVTVSAGRSFEIKHSPNYAHLVLPINTQALAAKLAALTGRPAELPLTFDAVMDGANPAAKALRTHFLFLVDRLAEATARLPKLMLREFEQTLTVLFLHANRHNYSHLLERPPAEGAVSQVRRAEEYIEANWQRAITVEGLAAAAGVSGLSLFRSFKKARGISPMDFLNQLRLRRSREMLLRPEADTTAATVAVSCGFGDLDRFTDGYVRAFGEQPSQTLARSKGAESS